MKRLLITGASGFLGNRVACLAVNPDCVLLRLSWMYDTKTMKVGEHSDFFRTFMAKMEAEEVLSYPIHEFEMQCEIFYEIVVEYLAFFTCRLHNRTKKLSFCVVS